jgi:hypothetical protein
MSMKPHGFAATMLIIASAAIASPRLLGEDVVITIRLINGKNGKPITDEDLNIFRNRSRFAENFRADRNGVIRLTIDHNAVVSFESNIQVACHKVTEAETSTHEPQRYTVSDIVEHGISDTNGCSKKIVVEAKPGEFVYYERPRTFWEWMAV